MQPLCNVAICKADRSNLPHPHTTHLHVKTKLGHYCQTCLLWRGVQGM